LPFNAQEEFTGDFEVKRMGCRIKFAETRVVRFQDFTYFYCIPERSVVAFLY
jgi:hypothetical protein